MILVIATVKPFRAKAVLDALGSVEVLGGTVREVMGYGRQKNRLRKYLGGEYSGAFVPKVEISLFLEDSQLPAALKAIVGGARTGRMGDGKVLVLPCRDEHVCWP